jgi:hypothetical protein
MLILLIVLAPAVESQARKPQTKKPTQAPAPVEPAPIATADHEAGGVEVALLEVKRTSGDAVTIRFRYTNKTTDKKKLDHGGQGLDAWRFGSDVYFVDPATNKKYTPLKDSNDYPIAARHEQFGVGITLAPRQVVNTWAKFPAPPPQVEVITVYLPGAPPFEEVAITK